MSPSRTQEELLIRMGAHDGIVRRLEGGFWTTPDTPFLDAFGGDRVPEWYVTIQTIRAAEKQGLIERTYEFPEDWRDTRRLVDECPACNDLRRSGE